MSVDYEVVVNGFFCSIMHLVYLGLYKNSSIIGSN